MKKTIYCILAALVLVMTLNGCAPKSISGDRWLMMQDDYSNDLSMFVANMDQVYSLYISGQISDDDFATEVKSMQKAYKVMEADYKEDKEENPIRAGSYSADAQRGINAIEDYRKAIGNIMTDSFDTNGDPISRQKAAYVYMGYGQQMAEDISVYTKAYNKTATKNQVSIDGHTLKVTTTATTASAKSTSATTTAATNSDTDTTDTTTATTVTATK